MSKSWIIKSILLAVGFFLLFSLVYRIGFSEVVSTVKKAKLSFALLGVLAYLVVIFFRSLRWFLLVKTIKDKISYKQFLPFYLANSLMGNLTPFKAGEATTPFLFKKYLKIPVGQGFSVIVLDRFLELITLTIISVLAIVFVLNRGIENVVILSVFRAMFIALFVVLAILITVIVSKRTALKIIGSFGFLRFVEKELDVFYDTLTLFKKAYRFLIPLILIGWFLEALAPYLVYKSIFPVFFFDVILAQMVTLGASLVTFIPGGVGIIEVSVFYILNLFGYSPILITGGLLLARLLLTGTLLASGLVGSILIKEEKHTA
mgnify:CR=1 FL=1